MSHVIFKREALFNPNRYFLEASLSTTGETSSQALYFKPDGTRVYYAGLTTDRVRSFDLTTPWDLRTATNNQVSLNPLYKTGTEQINPLCLNLNSNGTKMIVGGSSSSLGYLAVFDLNTPWDITTLSVTASQFSGTNEAGGITGISLSPDNTTLLAIYKKTTDNTKIYNISSSLDINTFILSSSYTFPAFTGQDMTGCSFTDNGKKIFISLSSGASAYARVYSVANPYTTEGIQILYQQNQVFSLYGSNAFTDIYARNDGMYYYGLSSAQQVIRQWKVL